MFLLGRVGFVGMFVYCCLIQSLMGSSWVAAREGPGLTPRSDQVLLYGLCPLGFLQVLSKIYMFQSAGDCWTDKIINDQLKEFETSQLSNGTLIEL